MIIEQKIFNIDSALFLESPVCRTPTLSTSLDRLTVRGQRCFVGAEQNLDESATSVHPEVLPSKQRKCIDNRYRIVSR